MLAPLSPGVVPKGGGFLQRTGAFLWGINAMITSLLDYPLRKASGKQQRRRAPTGRFPPAAALLAGTAAVPFVFSCWHIRTLPCPAAQAQPCAPVQRGHGVPDCTDGRAVCAAMLCALCAVLPAGGAIAGRTQLVRSSRASYDERLAAQLWDASADMAKLPRSPALG